MADAASAVAVHGNGSVPRNGHAVFLDRDGVINRRRLDHVKRWEEFEFLPGVFEALRELTRLNMRLVVLTNQGAVGRGLMQAATLERIHARMRAEVRRHGGRLEAVYACTHHPEAGCPCRKPRTALFERAAAELHITLAGSVMIGDTAGDSEAAQAVGCQPILVGGAEAAPGALLAADLREAASLAPVLLGRPLVQAC